MDIQKEMEQYEAVLKEAGYGHRSLSKSSLGYLDPITQFGFEVWFNAQKQAVPEGFVLAPVEEVKTWYLDDDESIYREDPDWLCNTPVGEVVEIERRISYELDQAPVFAAITWDEDNQDVGYYETFATKDEAKKAATHCKAMKEAQEPAND